jgi:hypothetical protein
MGVLQEKRNRFRGESPKQTAEHAPEFHGKGSGRRCFIVAHSQGVRLPSWQVEAGGDPCRTWSGTGQDGAGD